MDCVKFTICNLCPIYGSENVFGLPNNCTIFANIPENFRPIFPNGKKYSIKVRFTFLSVI